MSAKLRVVPVGDLGVDRHPIYGGHPGGYQRCEEVALQRKLSPIDEALLGVLHAAVSTREQLADGLPRLVLMDGQQRWLAAGREGYPTLRVDVHDGMSRREQAAFYSRMNHDRKALRPLALFVADVEAGFEPQTAILEAVWDAGLDVGQGKAGTGHIEAVETLKRIWERGGEETLKRTLAIVAGWKGDPYFAHTHIISGVAYLVDQHGPRLNKKRLEQLRTIPPAEVLRTAKGIVAAHTLSGNAAVGRAIAEEFRRRLRLRRSVPNEEAR